VKDAPRGFVGLAHFRDRILLPDGTAQERQAAIDAATAENILRVVQIADPETGTFHAALELVVSNPKVRQALTSSGAQA